MEYETIVDVELELDDEYPDPTECGVDLDTPPRGPGRPPKNGPSDFEEHNARRGKTLTEQRRQAAIDWLREHPDGGTQAEIVRALGMPGGNATKIFADPRFVTGDRGQKVGLDQAAIEAHKRAIKPAIGLTSSAIRLKLTRQIVYCELAEFGDKTIAQLVAVLKYDRRLIVEALASAKFEHVGGRWKIRKASRTITHHKED